MKNLRQELIDFINWKNKKDKNWLKFIDTKDVDLYLESINSTSNEVLTLSNNEAKEKKCQTSRGFCSSVKEPSIRFCGNCELWK